MDDTKRSAVQIFMEEESEGECWKAVSCLWDLALNFKTGKGSNSKLARQRYKLAESIYEKRFGTFIPF